MSTLQIIVGSTRPGRVGLPVSRWFQRHAMAHGGFHVELVDLAEFDLPLLDEPHHPSQRRYTHQHTRDWSTTVERADAFVFVTPEYNHAMPAALKNAIDYLFHEWKHKPAGIVSYGGVSAGTRALETLKQVITAVGVVPTVAAVNIPFVHSFMQDGGFQANEPTEQGATKMLDELVRLEATLAPLRRADRHAA